MEVSPTRSCFDDGESISTSFTFATSVTPATTPGESDSVDPSPSRYRSEFGKHTMNAQERSAGLSGLDGQMRHQTALPEIRVSSQSQPDTDRYTYRLSRLHEQLGSLLPESDSLGTLEDIAQTNYLQLFPGPPSTIPRRHASQRATSSSRNRQNRLVPNGMVYEAAWEDSSCVDIPSSGTWRPGSIYDDEDDRDEVSCDEQHQPDTLRGFVSDRDCDPQYRRHGEYSHSHRTSKQGNSEQRVESTLASTSNFEVEALRRQVEQLQMALLLKTRRQESHEHRAREQQVHQSGIQRQRSTSQISQARYKPGPLPAPQVPLPRVPASPSASVSARSPSSLPPGAALRSQRRSFAQPSHNPLSMLLDGPEVQRFASDSLSRHQHGVARPRVPARLESQETMYGSTVAELELNDQLQLSPTRAQIHSSPSWQNLEDLQSRPPTVANSVFSDRHPYSQDFPTGVGSFSVSGGGGGGREEDENRMEALSRKVEALERMLALSAQHQNGNQTVGQQSAAVDGQPAASIASTHSRTSLAVSEHQTDTSSACSSTSAFRFNPTGPTCPNTNTSTNDKQTTKPRKNRLAAVLKFASGANTSSLSLSSTDDKHSLHPPGSTETARVSWSRKRTEKVEVPKVKVRQGPGRGRVVIRE
ncbi:hypothetical protein BCV70DRAFT_219705 [Testicularia cyperi]|uniref:Uncharacterized protein n=1 Tax=Testicularia cyperi TaxID=1882483 RepID=A0A317XI28_9BASI|nr:hypothetical protein BCV70DRAFT_219705 [Testicularia cyperi]